MAALADIEELEQRLGEQLEGDAAIQALARLDDASHIVRAYAGTVSDDWAGADIPDAVPGIVASMVERATRNQDGVIQEGAGPFQRSFGADAANRLYLTKNDKMILRALGGGTATLGVIGFSRGTVETASPCGTDALADIADDIA